MRRRIFIVVIFLLAGAVVNVAVAWGCAFTVRLDEAKGSAVFVTERLDGPAIVDYWFVQAVAGIGVEYVAYTRTEFGRWTPSHQVDVDLEVVDRRSGHPHTPSGCTPWAPWPPDPRPPIHSTVVHVAVGLPLRCLESKCSGLNLVQPSTPVQPRVRSPEFRVFDPLQRRYIEVHRVGQVRAIEPSLRQSVPQDWSNALLLGDGSVLPYRPLLIAFTLNATFFATILGLLSWALLMLRGWIRVQRGLCPKCAYPMGESAVCTECGKPLHQRAKVTAT